MIGSGIGELNRGVMGMGEIWEWKKSVIDD